MEKENSRSPKKLPIFVIWRTILISSFIPHKDGDYISTLRFYGNSSPLLRAKMSREGEEKAKNTGFCVDQLHQTARYLDI